MQGWTLDDVRALDPDEYEVLVDEINAEARERERG